MFSCMIKKIPTWDLTTLLNVEVGLNTSLNKMGWVRYCSAWHEISKLRTLAGYYSCDQNDDLHKKVVLEFQKWQTHEDQYTQRKKKISFIKFHILSIRRILSICRWRFKTTPSHSCAVQPPSHSCVVQPPSHSCVVQSPFTADRHNPFLTVVWYNSFTTKPW